MLFPGGAVSANELGIDQFVNLHGVANTQT